MNNTAKTLLEKKLMDHRRNRRDYDDRRDYNYDKRDMYDYGDRRDYADRRDYTDNYHDYEYDERRRRDMNDYDMHNFKLSRDDIHEWSKHLDNKDGQMGPHFNEQQIINAAEKLGIRFDKYTEAEFCMTANMLYSDLCMDLRNVVPHDKEAIEYAKMARSWLEDSDTSAKNSEKLAIYYHCIVKK